jgi:urease accessory protein UreE
MICERVIGHVTDDAANVDWIDITWLQTVRRALRLKSRSGRAVDILLPRGAQLRHGDVVATVDGVPLAIWVGPCELLILQTANVAQASLVALELGNLHVAVEVQGDRLLTPDDGPAREIAHRHSIAFSTCVGRFHPLRETVQAPLNAPRD